MRSEMRYWTKRCPFCRNQTELRLNVADMGAYTRGVLAQDAFPNETAEVRELIMTGICPTCFPKGDDDE